MSNQGGVIWVNTREDPVPIALGRLRKALVRRRPGAFEVNVKTRSASTVEALQQWCVDQRVHARVDHYGEDGWVVRCWLLPTTLGGRFVARMPEPALHAA